MIYGRQSTALIVTVGPVLDADGVAVTGGVVADFKASKNGGAPAALNGSATLTHRHTGFYSLSLTTTDTNTVGTLEIVIDDTTNACPMKEITVLEEAIYDALFAASANAFQGAAGSTKVTGVVLVDTLTTYTGNTPQTGDSFARIGANGASLTSLATAAELAKVPKSDSNVTWNATAAAQIQGEANDALVAYDPPTRAEATADKDEILVVGNAVKERTDNLPDDPADASDVAAMGALIQADTDNIQTRLPAALVGGRMDSSVGAMANDSLTAAALDASAVNEIWAKTMTELAAVPGVTASVLEALQWVFLLSRNKITQTATTQTLRNDADSADIATSAVSDDGTTFERAEFS